MKNYAYYPDDAFKSLNYTGGGAASSTPSVSFTYKPDYARLDMITLTRPGPVTETITYTYNPITGSPTTGAGRVASIAETPANDSTTYGYDALGRVTSKLINGIGESFQYDNLNRILAHTTPLSATPFTISYLNATHRPLSISYPNGQISTFAWFNNAGDQRLKVFGRVITIGNEQKGLRNHRQAL